MWGICLSIRKISLKIAINVTILSKKNKRTRRNELKINRKWVDFFLCHVLYRNKTYFSILFWQKCKQKPTIGSTNVIFIKGTEFRIRLNSHVIYRRIRVRHIG